MKTQKNVKYLTNRQNSKKKKKLFSITIYLNKNTIKKIVDEIK